MKIGLGKLFRKMILREVEMWREEKVMKGKIKIVIEEKEEMLGNVDNEKKEKRKEGLKENGVLELMIKKDKIFEG